LITGKSGTGKEVIAHAIHRASPRAGAAFIGVNCAAIPESLLESELFGHVCGAFTGATGDKLGLFEQADGGTLLLDEIGEMPLGLQAKLLRVLQEEEIRRVGDHKTRRVDVRLLAATAAHAVTTDGPVRPPASSSRWPCGDEIEQRRRWECLIPCRGVEPSHAVGGKRSSEGILAGRIDS
jgi:two-component system response regulator AtoC